MKSRWISLIVFLSFTTMLFSLALKTVPDSVVSSAWGDDYELPFPTDATFTTLTTTPRAIEGLTGDNYRNLYTGGSGTPPCPVWRINIHNPILIPVGFVVLIQPPPPAPPVTCGFSGIAADETGNLYVADGGAATIYFFNPSAKNPPLQLFLPRGFRGRTVWPLTGAVTSGRVTEPQAREGSGR
jgi:hypothetical protein